MQSLVSEQLEVAAMQAEVLTIAQLLAPNTQYKVPIYQRVYSWDEKKWQQLWDDLEELASDPEPRKVHFLGPLICSEKLYTSESLTRYLLVDGQQRIATLLFLLVAFREYLKRYENTSAKAHSLNDYLTNQSQAGTDAYKLNPLADDLDIFREVIHQSIENPKDKKGKKHKILRAYEFFKKQIQDKKNELNFQDLVDTLLNRMTVIRIVLGQYDNAHEVFSSINAKGEQLKEYQLIKNYLFMHIAPHQQGEADRVYWQPLVEQVGDVHLTRFFNCFVNRKGTVYKVRDTYRAIRDEYKSHTQANESYSIWDYLEMIKRFAGYYVKFLKPSLESHPELSEEIEFFQPKILEVANPYFLIPHTFLLNLYEAEHQAQITMRELVESLRIVQNLLVRAILYRHSLEQFNGFFARLHNNVMAQKASKESYDRRLRDFIAHDPAREADYITDTAFEQFGSVIELKDPSDAGKEFILYLLKRMEKFARRGALHQANTFKFVRLMPKEVDISWKVTNNIIQNDYQNYINYLGNFALYYDDNIPEDSPFLGKKKRLSNCALLTNSDLDGYEKWNPDSILKRSKRLFNDYIKQIWPDLTLMKASAS